MSKRTVRMKMKARRQKVKQYILAGERSVRGLARKMDVSPATICRDLKAIEREWAEEIDPAERERHRITELKKLDQMEGSVAMASLGFLEGASPSDQERDIAMAIDAQRARLRLMERRARLLGLDTTNLNVREFGPADVLREMRKQAEESAGGGD